LEVFDDFWEKRSDELGEEDRLQLLTWFESSYSGLVVTLVMNGKEKEAFYQAERCSARILGNSLANKHKKKLHYDEKFLPKFLEEKGGVVVRFFPVHATQLMLGDRMVVQN
jgi:hypothetical protein